MQQAETLRQDPAPVLTPETPVAPLPAAVKAERPSAQITYVPTEKRQKLERRLTLVVTILPFIGFAWALIWLWGRAVGWLDLGLFFALYCFTGFGVTIGFHRMLTHRSFEASKPVKIILAVAGSMAIQGPVVAWVADHRRHHAFTDKPGDPHSPHLEEAGGVLGVLRGLWHSHLGWFFSPERTNVSRFAPDMEKD
ncbi:MAG: fatty acid desaturase, partial [Actinomycetota bacterium]